MMQKRKSPVEGEVVFWRITHDEDPRMVMYFAMVEGRAECVRIELGSTFLPGEEPLKLGARFDPTILRPLSTSALRRIRLHSRAKEARLEWVDDLKLYGDKKRPESTAARRREVEWRLPIAQQASARERPGPKPYPKEHFENVARVYLQAHVTRDDPTKAVQEHFRVSYPTAARWVGIARNTHGLLPETSRGKARSAPTLRAKNTSRRSAKRKRDSR